MTEPEQYEPNAKRGVRLLARVAVLVAIIVAVVAGGFSDGHVRAAVGDVPCFGAPAPYVTAFDAADGVTDGKASYPEPRFYDEQQTWATHRFETPGHHSEHVHFGLCVPNAQTMTATYRLDLGYTFHNMQDYVVTSAAESAVSASGSKALWIASASQLQQLNDAAQASCPTCPNNVQNVYFSVQTLTPQNNGLKEIRGAIGVSASGPEAVFLTWTTDPRWYETDNFAGLPDSTPLGNQRAMRVRPVVSYCKPDGDPATCGATGSAYHHSGFSGETPQDTTTCSGLPSGTNSAVWDADFIAQPWSGDHTVCLYVTDGGGPAFLMIDPDFHNHYAADGTSSTTSNICPNVDAAGNCLGKWFWQPSNTRKEVFKQVGVPVTIPASVIDSLSPGVHKLVFRSDNPRVRPGSRLPRLEPLSR